MAHLDEDAKEARITRSSENRNPGRRGYVCLFRFDDDAVAATDLVSEDNDGGELRVSNDSLIEMEGTAEFPDKYTKYISMKQVTKRFDTTNAAPYEEATARPDTGYHGTMLEMSLLFDEYERMKDTRTEVQKAADPPTPPIYVPDATGRHNRAKAIERLRDWEREDNSIRNKFRNGRIGLRNDFRPEWNVIPDRHGGYKIINFETFSSAEVPRWTTGYLTLQYSGYPGPAPSSTGASDARNRLGFYDKTQTDTTVRPFDG